MEPRSLMTPPGLWGHTCPLLGRVPNPLLGPLHKAWEINLLVGRERERSVYIISTVLTNKLEDEVKDHTKKRRQLKAKYNFSRKMKQYKKIKLMSIQLITMNDESSFPLLFYIFFYHLCYYSDYYNKQMNNNLIWAFIFYYRKED